jgi:hypothetical protein
LAVVDVVGDMLSSRRVLGWLGLLTPAVLGGLQIYAYPTLDLKTGKIVTAETLKVLHSFPLERMERYAGERHAVVGRILCTSHLPRGYQTAGISSNHYSVAAAEIVGLVEYMPAVGVDS